MLSYEERVYRMRRPLISRFEHEAEVGALRARIAELEGELATVNVELTKHERRRVLRMRGW